MNGVSAPVATRSPDTAGLSVEVLSSKCRKKHLGTLPQGTGFDLLNGSARRQRDEVELYPTARALSVSFGKASHPEAAAFTPDGASLITGSVDGFVEVCLAD